jgi:hypothetical protein
MTVHFVKFYYNRKGLTRKKIPPLGVAEVLPLKGRVVGELGFVWCAIKVEILLQ